MSGTASISADLHERAAKIIPAGVNSPVRAFGNVGGSPLFISAAKGAELTSADGKKFIDFVLGWGPAILGHADDDVVAAVQRQLESGMSYGFSCPLELELAELLTERIAGLEMLRFVSSGTEATMSALRLARGFTGRDYFIKCDGHYHGHSDALLVKSGSGTASYTESSSLGVTASQVAQTLCVDWNDLAQVEQALKSHPVAAVIVEPVPGNMGLVEALPGYLQGLRELCTKHGALLIFDEVMCGFRITPTTAAAHYGITPDLFCFGKVIGGGMPVGAFGGRRDVMSHIAPSGKVYQAGTLSGNPVAMRSGLATLQKFYATDAFAKASATGDYLQQSLRAILAGRKDLQFTRLGTMFCLFFHSGAPIRTMADVRSCDFARFGRFFRFCLARGIMLPPAQFEANFLSSVHTRAHIDAYVAALRDFLLTDQ